MKSLVLLLSVVTGITTSNVMANEVTHVIRPGDQLMLISNLFYGTHQKWKVILEANPGVEPRKLIVGQVLQIPDLGSSPENNFAKTETSEVSAELAEVDESADSISPSEEVIDEAPKPPKIVRAYSSTPSEGRYVEIIDQLRQELAQEKKAREELADKLREAQDLIERLQTN